MHPGRAADPLPVDIGVAVLRLEAAQLGMVGPRRPEGPAEGHCPEVLGGWRREVQDHLRPPGHGVAVGLTTSETRNGGGVICRLFQTKDGTRPKKS